MGTYVLTACFVVFVALLAVAAVSDVMRYVIPNSVPIALIVLFPIAAAASGGPVHLAGHLASATAVFAVGFAAHRLRLFGGGDVKLWTAAGLWTGLEFLPLHLVLTAFIGAALTVVLLILRSPLGRAAVSRALPARVGAMPRLLQGGAPVPYGLAIAVATVITMQQSPVFWASFGS